MVSRFKEALNSGKFVITSEIAPPKGTNLQKMLHHIDILKDKVDAINVTDHQSSVMRFPSLGGCLAIKEKDCAWTLIYNRLKDQGRLDLMRQYQPPRNHHIALRPRAVRPLCR